MNLNQWQKRAEHGTSGDMVHNILADWQRDLENLRKASFAERQRLYAGIDPDPDALLLAARKFSSAHFYASGGYHSVDPQDLAEFDVAIAEAAGRVGEMS